MCFFFFNDTATTEIYTLSLHDALPIYPAGDPRREPSGTLVMAHAPIAILQEADRHFGGSQFHLHRLQHHLGSVFPGVRLNVHPDQRVARDPAHAAMDIREFAGVEGVEDPGGQRSSEITMQAGHGAVFDVAFEARAHDEFVAFPKFFHERSDLAE